MIIQIVSQHVNTETPLTLLGLGSAALAAAACSLTRNYTDGDFPQWTNEVVNNE